MEIWKIRHSRAMVHLKTPYFEVVSICSRFYDEYCGLNLALFPTHNALLPQLCAKGTSLVVALLVHCISQPRAFSGKAACSLWCGYRIVYCAIPARDPSLINVTLFVLGTLSLLPERGMAHTRSRHTITLHFHCFLYLCILLR